MFTSSLGSVAILDSWGGSMHLGARVRIGSYQIQLSAGRGLGDLDTDLIGTVGIQLVF